MKIIDPKRYNLSPRLNLQQNELNELFIIVDRKSRIIMKDGHRILKIVNRIQAIEKDRHVSVLTSAPVCTKTRTFLSNNAVLVKDL